MTYPDDVVEKALAAQYLVLDRGGSGAEALRAALAAAEAAMAEKGYVTVPVEPTQAMLEVGDDGYYGMSGGDVWAAMIAARPTPPAASTGRG